MTKHLPTLAEAKNAAKELRKQLTADGTLLGHSQALDLVARDHGFRDWNGFRTAIERHRPDGWIIGERVTGHYLAQPFEATVQASERLGPGWFRLVLDLDEPVDVVRFPSFSNHRKRIRVEIGLSGHSKERTSDGKPHVELDL